MSGVHVKNKAHANVTGFKIRLKTVNYFPKNLGIFFEDLKSVEIKICHLREIHQSDLAELKKLEALDLSSNDLEIIEQGLFDNNLHLNDIDLYENKLIHIDPDVFDNLPMLHKLNLVDSGCSFPIIAYRSILSIIKEVKDRCVNLDYLTPEKKAIYLKNEEYKRQQELDFSIINNTIACELEKKFGVNIFWCKIKYNPTITTPESAQIISVFEINDKYEVTVLSPRDDIVRFEANNHLVNYFPRGLEKIFTNLHQIAIENCQLKEIHQSDLKPYTGLTFISLTDNLIKVIEDGLFDFNKELTEIFLSHNKIIHVGADAFSKLPRLQMLYLHGILCLDKAHITGCRDSYGLPHVIDILRRQCFNPNVLVSKTEANVYLL